MQLRRGPGRTIERQVLAGNLNAESRTQRGRTARRCRASVVASVESHQRLWRDASDSVALDRAGSGQGLGRVGLLFLRPSPKTKFQAQVSARGTGAYPRRCRAAAAIGTSRPLMTMSRSP